MNTKETSCSQSTNCNAKMDAAFKAAVGSDNPDPT